MAKNMAVASGVGVRQRRHENLRWLEVKKRWRKAQQRCWQMAARRENVAGGAESALAARRIAAARLGGGMKYQAELKSENQLEEHNDNLSQAAIGNKGGENILQAIMKNMLYLYHQ